MAWHEAAPADALGEDEALRLDLGGEVLALCKSGGEVFAVHNVCTHQFALLSDGYVENGCIECPLHQGRFDLRTGAALEGPVTEPVKTYPVKTENGKIFVDIPG